MPPRQTNDVTIGELARSVDELKTDFRELAGYLRQHVDALPTTYMTRAEADARIGAAVEKSVAGALRGQVSGLRQAMGVALPSLIAIAALAFSFVHH